LYPRASLVGEDDLRISIRVLGAAFLIFTSGISIAPTTRIAAAQSADANAGPEMSPAGFSDWMMVYYQAPRPDVVPAAVAKALEIQLFDGQHLPSLIGFMAGYFRDNPKQLDKAVEATDVAADRQIILASALLTAASGTPEATAITGRLNPDGQQILDTLSQMGIHTDGKVDPTSPFALDYAWGVFFATGDTRAVLPIVAALATPPKSDDVRPAMVAAAAGWSLGANARQHKKILDFCKTQISRQPADIAAKLKKIVEGADGG
jgi:hypothetical protein